MLSLTSEDATAAEQLLVLHGQQPVIRRFDPIQRNTRSMARSLNLFDSCARTRGVRDDTLSRLSRIGQTQATGLGEAMSPESTSGSETWERPTSNRVLLERFTCGCSSDDCNEYGRQPFGRDSRLRRARKLAKLYYMAYQREVKRILAIERAEAEDKEGDPFGDEGDGRRG